MTAPPLEAGSKSLISVTFGGLTWTDLVDPIAADMDQLAHEHRFHSLDIEDSLSSRQLTKVEDHGDHMFASLIFPDLDPNGIVLSRHVSIFIGKDYLVTVHPSVLKTPSILFQSCKDDPKKRDEFMKSPAYLAYRVIDRLVDGIFSILDSVQSNLDSIEAVVFNEKRSSSVAINDTRRQIATLRRIVYPLQLYLPDLQKSQKFSNDDLSLYFSDVRHKIGKISRMLDGMKETVEIYNDTDFVTSSNRTNTILSVLTIIFTLTLPATVLSAIYGMNVPLPGGLAPGPAEFFGEYTSLIIILIAMLVPTSIMTVYFKRAGWF